MAAGCSHLGPYWEGGSSGCWSGRGSMLPPPGSNKLPEGTGLGTVSLGLSVGSGSHTAFWRSESSCGDASLAAG